MKTLNTIKINQPAKKTEKPARRPPSIPLTRVGHVRDELAKVYREVRRGDLGSNEGGKLCYILMAIRQVIETGELESRVKALENGQEDSGNE